MEWKNYIVGLVDILGQGSKLDELGRLLWKSQKAGCVTGKEFQRIKELKYETSGEVECFRKSFIDLFSIMKKNLLESSNTNALLPDEEATVRKIADGMPKLRSFSDLVVFYIPFDAEDELSTRALASSMLTACAGVSISKFAKGTFFRGGIEIGAGTELSDGDLYGPALNDAYKLEKNVADYPRIVVGKKLSAFIKSEAHTSDTGEFLNGVLARADNLCKTLICQDSDGQVIVDYLGEGAFKLSQSSGSNGCSFVKQGITKVEESLNKYKKNGNQKLTGCHEKLLAYYQSRMKFWDNN